MDIVLDLMGRVVGQLQSPTLIFLLGGALAAAMGSKLQIPNQVYRLTVLILLLRVGLGGGIAIRNSQWEAILVPALFAGVIGAVIVLIGLAFFSLTPKVSKQDGLATAGLFGAVSSATLAAGMLQLEKDGIPFEPWVPALYPFMDIPALVSAIVLARATSPESPQAESKSGSFLSLIRASLQGEAVTALLLGVLLGILGKTDTLYKEFYDKLFPGFLCLLMLALGIEAWQRLRDLKEVAHWFGLYAIVAPILHGLIGFSLGWVAHVVVGLSPGGVIMLAIIAASNSDISGPPTLRAGIPRANPSAYIGASTGLGTPVAIALCIPIFTALGKAVFGLAVP